MTTEERKQKILQEIQKNEFPNVAFLYEKESLALFEEILKELLIKESDEGKNKFIIDFSELVHINSLAMGILRGRLREVRESSGDIKLANLNPHIATIFEMVGLDEIFEIYSSEEEALQKF